MTPSVRRGLGLTFALLLAAVAQSVFAHALTIFHATPDFLLTTALLGALFCDANGAAALGFFAGLFHASLASPPAGGFGAHIVSRTIVTTFIGWLDERLFRDSPWIALAVVPVGTLAAELLFFIFAPQPNFLHWGRVLLGTTAYNTILALPLYFLLARLTKARKKDEFAR